ncbi:MAG: copper resistance CopC/CopD family protein [Intrasporangium sp.]|uniref:copper resistance CopC/CopD family protein n=1 Tax=Intrasporangium sp. TaxID=1925024 RepID=UPI003F7F21B3
MSRDRRLVRAAGPVLAALAFAVLQIVGGLNLPHAQAHADLLEAHPQDDSVVRTVPDRIWLRFSEAVMLGPRSIQLLDANGDPISTAPPVHLAGAVDTAAVTPPADLPDGTYVVSWRVTSADSHVVAGAFRFSVGAPSATSAATVEPPDAGPVLPVLDAVGRGVAFLGLALATGGWLLVIVLWPNGMHDRRACRLVWAGLGALAVASVVIFLVQAPYAEARPLSHALSPDLLAQTAGTRLGIAVLVRLALVAVLALCFARLVRQAHLGASRDLQQAPDASPAPYRVARAWATAYAVLAAGLPLTWTLADHAQSGDQVAIAVPATTLHLLAMALWLGGLVVLLARVIGRAAADRTGAADKVDLAPALQRFSRLALWCFVVLAVTGTYLGWRQVGEPGALVGTRFGLLLIAKLALVLLVVVLADRARRFVSRHTRSVGADADGASSPATVDAAPLQERRRLRTSVAVEVVVGLLILGVTSVLVDTAPARTSYSPPFRATVHIGDDFAVDPALSGGRLEIAISPARRGTNAADIYLRSVSGDLVDVPQLEATLIDPADPEVRFEVPIAGVEPGHYSADALSVPYVGDWQLRLTARLSEFDEASISVPFRAR